MNFETIKQLTIILFDFHGCYFSEKDVLTPQNKDYRLNNLKLIYEYFSAEKNALEQQLNFFIKTNSKRKDRTELDKAKENRAALRTNYDYVSFLVGKCCLGEDDNYANQVLNSVSSNWERAYAAKLLTFQTDIQVNKFIDTHGLTSILNAECSKVKEKFTNCFNDFNLVKMISRERSVNFQCLLYLLLCTVDNILSLLQVDFNNDERKVAHYTSLYGFKKIICDESPLRLASGDLMNDPSEGRLLYEFLNLENELIDDTFLTSFTFNHNSLNQFRLYGCTDNKEGTGISLVVDHSFFSKDRNGFISSQIIGDSEIFKILTERKEDNLPLFRCIYFDKSTGYLQVARRSKVSFYQEYVDELKLDSIAEKCDEYEQKLKKLEGRLYSQILTLKKLVKIMEEKFNKKENLKLLLKRTLRPLCFLFKHIAFQEEQECRIFYITEIGNPILEQNDESMVIYYPYKPNIKDALQNVYLGPALQEKFTFVRKAVVYDENIKVKVCDSPFVSK